MRSVTKTLKQYDTKRYEKLSWKNPNPNPGPVNHDILLWQHCLEDCEDGLLWDMLTQLGNLFKSGQGTQIAGKRSGEDLCDQLFAVFHAVIYLYQCIP